MTFGAAPGHDAARRARRRGARDEPPADASRPPEPEADPRSVARTIALRVLAARPCSVAELRTKLAGRGVPPAIAEEVLGRFAELGYLDDRSYAESLVAAKHRSRGLARRALAAELRQRGIDDDDVSAALQGLSAEQELATATELVTRKLRSMGNLDPAVRRRRLAGMLARKGYPPGLAAEALRAALGATETAG